MTGYWTWRDDGKLKPSDKLFNATQVFEDRYGFQAQRCLVRAGTFQEDMVLGLQIEESATVPLNEYWLA